MEQVRNTSRGIMRQIAEDVNRGSMQHAYPAVMSDKTQNPAVCQHLLGDKDIGSPAHYLDVDQRAAFDLAKSIPL